MNIDFFRSNDHQYCASLKNEETGKELTLYMNTSKDINPNNYHEMKKVANYLNSNISNLDFKNNGSQDILLDGKTYRIKLNSRSLAEKALKSVSNFFKFIRNESRLDLTILDEEEIKRDAETQLLEMADANGYIHVAKPIDRKKGGMIHFPIEILPQPRDTQTSPFTDGFSNLAREAFQKFEPEFAAHDNPRSLEQTDHSRYKIILQGNELKLIDMKDNSSDEGAMSHFVDFLVAQYGREKVVYMASQYHIDLNSNVLTPEIVYRMNIGMGNLEIQDVNQFKFKLNTIDINAPHLMNLFTAHELRNIQKEALSNELTVDQLKNWITEFQALNDNAQLVRSVSILNFTDQEKRNQYTGREILEFIGANYTIADSQAYKPWVDQQELLQTFSLLENSVMPGRSKPNWDGYCELLSHIVCKKHLGRIHPQEDFRVGALIPAPKDENGDQRWYVLSSMVANGRGILSYTLEPLNTSDPTLPAIKLFRSTSSSSFAFQGLSSVYNDINPINSPGYEGVELSRPYEIDFFKERTIPLWVGLFIKSGAEPLEMKRQTLSKAIEEYEKDVMRDYQPVPFKQLIQENDFALLELARNLSRKDLKMMKLMAIIRDLKYEISPEQELHDSAFLLNLLPQDNPSIYKLRRALEKKVLGIEEPLPEKAEQIKTLKTWMEEDKIDDVAREIETIALKEKEMPHQKKQQNILITGHSLGGACAQKCFVDYTANFSRIPLPHTGEISLRAFDAPGINRSDNVQYKAYGEKNYDLFAALDVKFEVIHRMEQNDFFALGGQEHVGGAKNETESNLLTKWTHFEAAVSAGRESSTTPHVRDALTAHAARFDVSGVKRHPAFAMTTKENLKKAVTREEAERIERWLAEHQGDFERTSVDPRILHSFDIGGKHHWEHIKSPWGEFMKATRFESLRNVFSMVTRIALASFLPSPEKSQGEGHGDISHLTTNGVFAVNLNGVQTRPPPK